MDKSQDNFLDDHSDDLYGLWEVRWYFKNHAPSMGVSEQSEYVRNLVERHLLKLYFSVSPSEPGASLSVREALDKINSSEFWSPPPPGFAGKLCYVMSSPR